MVNFVINIMLGESYPIQLVRVEFVPEWTKPSQHYTNHPNEILQKTQQFGVAPNTDLDSAGHW